MRVARIAAAEGSVGRFVRLVAPGPLVEWLEEELGQARQQYERGPGVHMADSDRQPGLPFPFNQIGTA
jgi:hypothetical protein